MIEHLLGIPGGRVPEGEIRIGRKPGKNAEKKQEGKPFAPKAWNSGTVMPGLAFRG